MEERGSWRGYISRICVIWCWSDVYASGSVSAHAYVLKEIKESNPLQEGLLKGIESSVGMQPYKGGMGIKFRGH